MSVIPHFNAINDFVMASMISLCELLCRYSKMKLRVCILYRVLVRILIHDTMASVGNDKYEIREALDTIKIFLVDKHAMEDVMIDPSSLGSFHVMIKYVKTRQY